MKSKYIAAGVVTVAFLFLYNSFLISRDRQLFEAYYETRNETPVGTAANR